MGRIVVYDCEFLEDGRTIDLISIGMVDDAGREFYAVNRDAPWKRISKHPWLPGNVVPHLPRLHGDARMQAARRNYCAIDWTDARVRPLDDIMRGVRQFLLGTSFSSLVDFPAVTELWADHAAYDHVALAQLFGTMMDLPDGLPMYTNELQQEWQRAGRPTKPQHVGEHNALHDARYGMALWRLCTERA
jgi:hypothetical protein